MPPHSPAFAASLVRWGLVLGAGLLAAAGPKRMIRIWANHVSVQAGRDEWLAEQLNALPGMAAESQPAGQR